MNNPSMDSEKKREMVSALADGQLSGMDFAHAVEVTVTHGDSREAWHAYHLVGDALRAGDLATCVVREDFMTRLQARLREEACHGVSPKLANSAVVPLLETVPRPEGAANASVFRWKMVAGFASFVAVFAVGWSMLSASGGGGASGVTLASVDSSLVSQAPVRPLPQSTLASSPAAVAAQPQSSSVLTAKNVTPDQNLEVQQVMIRDPHLDALLAAHKQFGGTSALQGPAGFLRNATFESSGR